MAGATSGRSGVTGAATVAALLVAWYCLTTLTQTISTTRFPAPLEVWQALQQITLQGYADAKLHVHILHSCKLVLYGFLAAIAAGVPLGLLMGWSRKAEALINPAFLLLRPIPPLAWIPLAIVWLGLDDASKVLVIWFAAFVPSVKSPVDSSTISTPASPQGIAAGSRSANTRIDRPSTTMEPFFASTLPLKRP